MNAALTRLIRNLDYEGSIWFRSDSIPIGAVGKLQELLSEFLLDHLQGTKHA